jgi:hypothetical protein
MVHEVILFKLSSDCTEETIESLMVESRMRLLKIPEVQRLACGKPINGKDHDYDFFLNLEFENMTKRKLVMESPVYVQFDVQILRDRVKSRDSYLFEAEPGKDVRYS